MGEKPLYTPVSSHLSTRDLLYPAMHIVDSFNIKSHFFTKFVFTKIYVYYWGHISVTEPENPESIVLSEDSCSGLPRD